MATSVMLKYLRHMWGLVAITIWFSQFHQSTGKSAPNPSLTGLRKGGIAIPVYWINLDSDLRRRQAMEVHVANEMNFNYQTRISALTPSTANIVMLEHECRRFSLADIAILASHLKAIRTAVYDPAHTDYPYAIILEDDIRFQYDIDFDALIALAPAGFGILQLMTSHVDQIVGLWESYRYRNELWTFRRQDSSIWSAQAYIIKKSVLKPFIDAAVLEQLNPQTKQKELQFKIVQTFDGERGEKFRNNAFKPTVMSICIFADMFVYAAGRPTYILNTPLLNSAGLGMNSTAHSTHVGHHARGYAYHQQTQIGMNAGVQYTLPAFAKVNKDLLRHNMAINWTKVAIDNPIRHWAQGSYKIANVD